MAGTYDGKKPKAKKKAKEWCTDHSEIWEIIGRKETVRFNKKYRCPTCGKRLKATESRGLFSCQDSDCVRNHTHARLPPHKAK